VSAETHSEPPTRPATGHPLEPLSAEEIAATSAILGRERSLSQAVRFTSIELHESSKQTVLNLTEGQRSV
jgi:primary-amine oxidase